MFEYIIGMYHNLALVLDSLHRLVLEPVSPLATAVVP